MSKINEILSEMARVTTQALLVKVKGKAKHIYSAT